MNNALNIIESAPTTHTEEQSVRFNGWTHFHATSDQYQGPKALLIYTSTQMVADFGLVDDKGRAVGGEATVTSVVRGDTTTYSVLVQPTRNGQSFGASQDAKRAESLDAAFKAARAGLARQAKSYAKKFAK
jgi:UPF0288 family protein (methanogenesis marker protein 3)